MWDIVEEFAILEKCVGFRCRKMDVSYEFLKNRGKFTNIFRYVQNMSPGELYNIKN